MDPFVFEELLYFLYTGMLKRSSVEAAVIYKVDTLKRLYEKQAEMDSLIERAGVANFFRLLPFPEEMD